MTMPTSSSMVSGQNSLPPLHQAIPEFHSHTPHERPSSSVPRKLVHERHSPSYGPSNRASPSSSSGTISESVNLASLNEPMGTGYESPMYMYPGPPMDQRRMSVMSTGSSSYAPDARGSPHLPPVTSMTSSRGSSFDIDATERPPPSMPLPSMFNNQQQPPAHLMYGHFPPDPRGQQIPQDYHQRYSMSSDISTAPYRSTSPIQQYSQPQFYAHAHAPYPQQQPRNPGYVARQPAVIDVNRSPFSTGAPPVDLNVDHFDQARPGKRRRGNLPKHVTDLLRTWLNEHVAHPYPTEDEKQRLMHDTGLTIHQISNWFINARRRRLPNMTNGDSRGQSSNRQGQT